MVVSVVVLSLVVIMFSFWHFAPVERFAGKIVCEYNVSNGMLRPCSP